MATSTKIAGRGITSGPTADWVNPNNITASNNTYATVSLSFGSVFTEVSDFLRADQFAFDIPAFSTIDGIIATVERKASSASTIIDYAVQPLKNGTVPVGYEDKSTGGSWSTTEGFVTYGSTTDLWGVTWTPNDINNAGTGFAIRCEYTPAYGSATAYVDAMYMTVYYTLNGIKFGTTSVGRIYHGSTTIKAAYHGSTQIG
jgi:hypothetical protein